MMTQRIDLNDTVYDTLEQHPELKPLLVELGFAPLANKAMLQTAGRMTTLKKGADLISIPVEKIVRTLEFNGYEVLKDGNENTI